MGRMIDTDDLKKVIDDWRPLCTGCTPIVSMQFGAMMAVKDIMKLIDDTPTAYKIDKIVEQLNGLIEEFQKQQAAYIREEEWGCAEIASGGILGVCKAIEIVKKGGIK